VFAHETTVRLLEVPLYHSRKTGARPSAYPSTAKIRAKENIWAEISYNGANPLCVRNFNLRIEYCLFNHFELIIDVKVQYCLNFTGKLSTIIYFILLVKILIIKQTYTGIMIQNIRVKYVLML
jgi:hypothetical protein